MKKKIVVTLTRVYDYLHWVLEILHDLVWTLYKCCLFQAHLCAAFSASHTFQTFTITTGNNKRLSSLFSHMLSFLQLFLTFRLTQFICLNCHHFKPLEHVHFKWHFQCKNFNRLFQGGCSSAGRAVVCQLKGRLFAYRLLRTSFRSVLGQDTEPKVASVASMCERSSLYKGTL